MKLLVLAATLAALPGSATASAGLAEGKALVESKKCEACHQEKVYGPAGTVYLRKDRKVGSWAKLKAQVALCNSELNLGLFPEEEESVAAFLDATYYKLPRN
jgi:hypothetical protein